MTDSKKYLLFNHVCYPFLKKEQAPAEQVMEKSEKIVFPVCWSGKFTKEQVKDSKRFLNFSSYDAFFRWQDANVDEEQKCFFEIYMSTYHQGVKLYYDLDIEVKKYPDVTLDIAETIMNEVIEKTIDELSQLKL